MIPEQFQPMVERYDSMVETTNSTIAGLRSRGSDEITITLPREDVATALKAIGVGAHEAGEAGIALSWQMGAVPDDLADQAIATVQQALDGANRYLDVAAAFVAAVQGTEIPDEMPSWFSEQS